jgi:hypothetical protein
MGGVGLSERLDELMDIEQVGGCRIFFLLNQVNDMQSYNFWFPKWFT